MRRLGISAPLAWSPDDEANAGEMMAAAFPDRIARRRDLEEGEASRAAASEGVFRFPSGREARCNAPLAGVQWLCALEVDSGERMGYIRLAAPVSEATALRLLESRIVTEKTVEWNGLIPRLHETKRAGRIPLGGHKRPCRRDELLPFLPTLFAEQGLSVLPWDENRGAAQRLLDRIRFFVNHNESVVNKKPPQSDISLGWDDESLITEAADWLGPFIWDGSDTGKGEIINADCFCNALANRLGWEDSREMDQLVPDQFVLPSGRKRPFDYRSGDPVLCVRLQDAFGITGNCAVLGVPIVFHLLSPADRPIQITRDLPGFWAGSYAEVRKEMRGRYPKHNWPEM